MAVDVLGQRLSGTHALHQREMEDGLLQRPAGDGVDFPCRTSS